MNEYKFTENWFDVNEKFWAQLFNEYQKYNKVSNVLEIGCYEGRATIWLCENVLDVNSNYVVVDTFSGTDDETGMKATRVRKKGNNSFIKDNFLHNISYFKGINFEIHEGISQQILPQIYEKYYNTFDVIYIDASHKSDDTIVDAYYSDYMLKQGGLMIFDDFEWKDPNDLYINNSPKAGIQMFVTLNQNKYNIASRGYQLVLQKNEGFQ